jgi:thiopeptide-type bacteriocin biosynthesis protein
MAAPLAGGGTCGSMWLRYDLDAVSPGPPTSLYATLGGTAAMLLHGRAATDLFFVHTPAGLRLRCLASQPNTADVAWQAALAEARGRGWLAAWRPAPFEPSLQGFGGPEAMAAAHRVFTADSLAWLGYHARAARPVPTVARWSASLLMIRALTDGLGLTARESDDLWDRIGRSTRRLQAFDPADPATRRLATALRAGWDEPGTLRDRLDPQQADLVATYESAVGPAAAAWRDAAHPGWRHGVALAVLFHWNRAGMPVSHQRLLATALSRLTPAFS